MHGKDTKCLQNEVAVSEKHFVSGISRDSLADKTQETWILCPPQQRHLSGLGCVPARAGLDCRNLGNPATEI